MCSSDTKPQPARPILIFVIRECLPLNADLSDCRLGRYQRVALRGSDRQPYGFTTAAGRQRRRNAIAAFWIGRHGLVEQDRIAALQRHPQGGGWLKAEELKVGT